MAFIFGATMKNPASRAIHAFGGVRALARALNIESSTVSRWQRRRSACGLSGLIPASHQAELLRIAKLNGINLSAADLIHDAA